MAEGFIQTNVNLTEEDNKFLDRMMVDDGFDNRSAFMRRLVRQEWARRVSQPNQLITVAEAEINHT
jgi:Arc/MetJ-type ribon-helix-helix transcriptional regulator